MQRAFQHILLFVLCLGAGSTAFGQFFDDFNDNDFTTGVVWAGDDVLFTAVTGQLQSQSAGAATFYLSTPSALATDAQWTFFVDLKFSTSGSNYVDVFLMSDDADLNNTQNGYFVRIGDTPDHIELSSLVAGTTTSMIASPAGIVNSGSANPFMIQVTRDLSDSWTLLYDDGNTGTFTNAGSIVDAAVNSSTHFGILIEQSSAASPVNNHFFDDIEVINIPVDLDPPTIDTVVAISATQIDVRFNEALDQTTAEDINNYDIQPFLSASAATLDGTDPTLVHITPISPLTSGNSYNMIVTGVEDLAGNANANQQFMFSYFVPSTPSYRSVVINEVFPDPSPVVGLPEVEYVEVFNTSMTETYDLDGWELSDASSSTTLPPYVLLPGEHAVIVNDDDAPLFFFISNVIPVGTLPSMNNSADIMTLEDDMGNQIDQVAYDLTWYGDPDKDDGGYTLEQINPFVECSGSYNWHASNAPNGGTPGAQNSVFALVVDQTPPALIGIAVIDATTLELVFDEALDSTSVPTAMYDVQAPLPIAQIRNVPPMYDRVQLEFSSPMVQGETYSVAVTDLMDCPGNLISGNNSIAFGLPQPPAYNDVVINEVLYDPRTGGSDFVELFNRSDKVVSLAGWQMVTDDPADAKVITTEGVLLLPGQYLLLTEDLAAVASEYPLSRTDRFFPVDLPTYSNGDGTVALWDSLGNELDLFNYDDDLHFTLLNSTDGVSLERVSPERPASEATNWHSAAENVGFATPGYQNSQYSINPEASGDIEIDNAIFSPDNDGFEDLATLSYKFDEPGFVGNITIYDTRGREVRKLMENELLGITGSISWDGVGDDNEKGRVGPYILFFEVFDLNGNTLNFKETLVLAHKVN